jgi:hypothetical protein
MPELTIAGKRYEYQKPSKIALLPIAKYLMALDINSSLGLTDDIAQAAASALKRIVPDIDPAIATPAGLESLDVEGITQLVVDLFGSIEQFPLPLPGSANGMQSTPVVKRGNHGAQYGDAGSPSAPPQDHTGSTKSAQIASLKAQLQLLENS